MSRSEYLSSLPLWLRCLALIRFQLSDTPISRLQLNETLALLLEELKESNASSPESH
jgi:hypothetical protein